MTRPITPRHVLRLAISVLMAASLFLIATDASAHTDDELDEWRATWTEEAITQGGLTPELVAEWNHMRDLHGCDWPGVECAPIASSFSPPNDGAFRGMGSDVEQWRGLVATYFAPSDVELALRVMSCESGGNPNAKNPNSSASGLFQHLGRFWTERSAAAGWAGADIFDPEANVAVAAWLRNDGWHHWNPSKHCWG